MAWIASRQELLNHPKTLDLMSLMGWDIDQTIGKLHRFWWWCMDYAPDGDLRGHNPARLAGAVGLPQEEGDRFVDAMIKAVWLDQEPFFRVHDWWDNAGMFLQMKYKRRPERWRRVRASYLPAGATEQDELLLEQTGSGNSLLYPYSTGTNAQNGGDCTGPTNQHNLAIYKKDKQDQPGDTGAVVNIAAGYLDQARQSRSDSESSSKEIDLEAYLMRRLSPEIYLSQSDMRKIEELQERFGKKFWRACESLNGKVMRPYPYLKAVLQRDT